MAERRASNYQGHKIVVEVTSTNRVYYEIHSEDELLKREMSVGSSPEDQIAGAWVAGKEFVDKRLGLREALRVGTPAWEFR